MSIDKQNLFVILSSLVLHHTAKQFPLGISLKSNGLSLLAKKHGLEELIKEMHEIIEPTINWLKDEKYIRGPVSEEELYTITEKGLTSCDHKFPQAPNFPFELFTTMKNGEYFFKEDKGFNKEINLKCTGPVLNFLPEGWFQAD